MNLRMVHRTTLTIHVIRTLHTHLSRRFFQLIYPPSLCLSLIIDREIPLFDIKFLKIYIRGKMEGENVCTVCGMNPTRRIVGTQRVKRSPKEIIIL